jgi:hypothetical protein
MAQRDCLDLLGMTGVGADAAALVGHTRNTHPHNQSHRPVTRTHSWRCGVPAMTSDTTRHTTTKPSGLSHQSRRYRRTIATGDRSAQYLPVGTILCGTAPTDLPFGLCGEHALSAARCYGIPITSHTHDGQCHSTRSPSADSSPSGHTAAPPSDRARKGSGGTHPHTQPSGQLRPCAPHPPGGRSPSPHPRNIMAEAANWGACNANAISSKLDPVGRQTLSQAACGAVALPPDGSTGGFSASQMTGGCRDA